MRRWVGLSLSLALTVAPLAAAGRALAQEAAPSAGPSPQSAAIAKLDFMRGVWVGPATGTNRDGGAYAITQTERIGTMLGGDVLVIEGRGYRPDGATAFNAFAVISWNAETSQYEFRSYAQGHAGTFPFTLTGTGYSWEVPAGPGVMHYVADVTPTTFHEVGDFVMPGRPPMRSFEMTLTRRGDTDWPAADPVSPTE